MSCKLDRVGTFRAIPISWGVQAGKDSQSVFINMGFKITAMLNGSDWMDWSEYQEHTVYGSLCIVKKDGSLFSLGVENLAKAIGWDGDLMRVESQPVPDTPCQITVEENEWQGSISYKVAWVNPYDSMPQANHLDGSEVSQLSNRFGSLLRACAGAVAQVSPPKAEATPPPAQPAEAPKAEYEEMNPPPASDADQPPPT